MTVTEVGEGSRLAEQFGELVGLCPSEVGDILILIKVVVECLLLASVCSWWFEELLDIL